MDSTPTIIEADGEYGPFHGALQDQVVFGTYRREGRWSDELLRLVTGLLREGGTLIDGGANIGLLSIPVATRTGAQCIAVEPEPLNFELLVRNVEAHDLQQRVTCLQVALYSHAGRFAMQRSGDNYGDHRVLPEAPQSGGEPWVRAERLDRLLEGKQLDHPLVLKLDTQGCEARALLGAGELLERVDYAICEYWPAGLLRQGDRVEQLESLLHSFPYARVLSAGTDDSPLQSVERALQDLSWIPRDGSDEGFFDLLLARRPELVLR